MRMVACFCFLLVIANGVLASPRELAGESEVFQLRVEGADHLRTQNLSGGTIWRNILFLVDDGGAPHVNDLFTWDGNPDSAVRPAVMRLPARHTDIEAAASDSDYLYITTSMSSAEPDIWSSEILTRAAISPWCECITEVKTVRIKPAMAAALNSTYPGEWAMRVLSAAPKQGGINAEGLATHPGYVGSLFIGLRSPLRDNSFGVQDGKNGANLGVGMALVAQVSEPFSHQPGFRFYEVDLGGLGIRSMEYAPSLGAFVIIAGQADLGNSYAAYLWSPDKGGAKKISISRMGELCRPEVVFEWVEGDKRWLYLLSEKDGAACLNSKIDGLRVRIK